MQKNSVIKYIFLLALFTGLTSCENNSVTEISENNAQDYVRVSDIYTESDSRIDSGFITSIVSNDIDFNDKISTSVTDIDEKEESFTGHYSNSELFVDVNTEKNTIRIEYVSPEGIISAVQNSCDISDQVEFTAEDLHSKNSYLLNFSDDSVHVTIKKLEIIDQLNGWSIPDIDTELSRTSLKPKNYDITSWSTEMIAAAINNYFALDNQYELQLSDVYSNHGIVRHKDSGLDAKMIAGWGLEDYAILNMRHTGGTGKWFHLKDYLDEEKFDIKNDYNKDQEINIEDYYGEYSGGHVYLDLHEIPENKIDNYHSVEVYLTLTYQNGNRVGDALCVGHIEKNTIQLDGGTNDFFITIKDNKLFFSCYCMSESDYFHEEINQELQKMN